MAPLTQGLARRWAGRVLLTEADGLAFIEDCERSIGLGFHPDTRFDDYVIKGVRTYSDVEACMLDKRMDEAFLVLEDVYAVSLDALHRIEKEASQ